MNPTFEPSFCAMLTRCSSLQALIIQNPLGVVPYHHNHNESLESYQVNIINTLLVDLATACTQLKQLTIILKEHVKDTHLQDLIDMQIVMDPIIWTTYLKMNLNTDDYDIPQTINMLPRLVTLYCSNLGSQTRFAVYVAFITTTRWLTT